MYFSQHKLQWVHTLGFETGLLDYILLSEQVPLTFSVSGIYHKSDNVNKQ